jgi:hypothetical protein
MWKTGKLPVKSFFLHPQRIITVRKNIYSCGFLAFPCLLIELTTNCFSPPGPIVGTLLWASLSVGLSHFHLASGGGWPDRSTIDDFISCSHRLPGDQMLWLRDRPFSDRLRGASSSAKRGDSSEGGSRYWQRDL